jgi:F-type H+-transporting ATPase subunit alpha
MSVAHQVAIIFCGSQNLLKEIPVKSVIDFETEYLAFLDAKHADTLKELGEGKYTDSATEIMTKVAADIANKYKE